MQRVNSAREQGSSIGGDAVVICLGVVHMEEEVQDRVQEEVGREEQGEGQTHGESQNEETTRNKRSTTHHGWYEHEVMRSSADMQCDMQEMKLCKLHEKNDV